MSDLRAGDALVAEACERLQAHLGQGLFGLDEVVRLLFCTLLCEGHALLEEVPGTGKTSLAKAMAAALDLGYSRLQFTPDLLPSDVTGLYWFNQRSSDFEFRPGPIFTSVLLADEINRATPRTQSALLEAMAESQVTIEGRTHALPRPFLVIATQNPVELEGTFPLPEAQVDRFLLRLRLGYPDEAAEHAILLRHASSSGSLDLGPLSGLPPLDQLASQVRAVRMEEPVRQYLVGLVRSTRELEAIELGVSPRGSIFLHRAAQAYAATEGRDFVIPDDVKAVAPSVLAHRLRLESGAELRGETAEGLLDELLDRQPVPVEA